MRSEPEAMVSEQIHSLADVRRLAAPLAEVDGPFLLRSFQLLRAVISKRISNSEFSVNPDPENLVDFKK